MSAPINLEPNYGVRYRITKTAEGWFVVRTIIRKGCNNREIVGNGFANEDDALVLGNRLNDEVCIATGWLEHELGVHVEQVNDLKARLRALGQEVA